MVFCNAWKIRGWNEGVIGYKPVPQLYCFSTIIPHWQFIQNVQIILSVMTLMDWPLIKERKWIQVFQTACNSRRLICRRHSWGNYLPWTVSPPPGVRPFAQVMHLKVMVIVEEGGWKELQYRLWMGSSTYWASLAPDGQTPAWLGYRLFWATPGSSEVVVACCVTKLQAAISPTNWRQFLAIDWGLICILTTRLVSLINLCARR